MILFAQDALVLRWDESDNDQGGHEDNLASQVGVSIIFKNRVFYKA